ncbi:MAG: DNA-processing protein DprA [Acidimicrobiales bacterium]|jgi:DNA processing protein
MSSSGDPTNQRAALPDLAYAATLAGLVSMTPQRLQRLLRGRPAEQVFTDLRTRARLASRLMRAESIPGHRALRTAQILDAWRKAAIEANPALVWEQLSLSGTTVWRRGSPGYPARLAEDRAAPEVLFARGSIAQLDGPCVALVGTRSATYYGSSVAAELGANLSDAGVVVLSGLAAGIDAAAHEGALAPESPTPPVAVVGGGVDVVYPASSGRLWARLEAAGGILSEAPPGAAPERWRFPLRNRLIAALAHVVVVVESHKAGGALHTVAAADERGVTVLAVPGSVRSPASEGTNSLIADGCGMARDAADVLAALELACAGDSRRLGPGVVAATRASAPRDTLPPVSARLSATEHSVLEALEDVAVSFELVCERSGLELATTAVALEHLAALGLAVRSGSGWERRDGRRG